MDDETPTESLVPENDNLPDVAELPPSEFKHWYNLAFCYSNGAGHIAHACVHMGYDEMKLTRSRIEFAAQHVSQGGVDPKSIVLLSASYLGFMTETEFNS